MGQYSAISGMLVLADDSGLEVECLNGRPGVLSARYGGDNLSDEERNSVIIELGNLKSVPLEMVVSIAKELEKNTSFLPEARSLHEVEAKKLLKF